MCVWVGTTNQGTYYPIQVKLSGGATVAKLQKM
jgi:hypothetical protein